MKNYLLIIVLFFFAQQVYSQIGISAGFRSFSNDEWSTALNNELGGNSENLRGQSISLDYWFRLRKRRIEFTPEFTIGQFKNDIPDYDQEHKFISFHFNTNIYLFDLAEDCDCPVWSKEGNILKKGFFLQISPGVSRMKNTLGSSLELSDETNNYLELGVGAGLDIGLSDFFTITPMVKFIFSQNAEWSGINAPGGAEVFDLNGDYRQLYAGLRLGFRFDKISRY